MHIPPVTKYLLWAIGIGYLLQLLAQDAALMNFALWPWGNFEAAGGQFLFRPWQLVTYALLHGSFTHLFLNAFGLIQFGPRVEMALGRRRFIQFVLVCTVGAGLCQLLVTTLMVNAGSPPFPTLGASGFIYGILLGYGAMFPHERIMMILPPVEMSARTFVIVFGAIELITGVTGTMGGVAHFAHLGGMLFGWLLLRYWSGKPPFGKRKPQRPKPRLHSIN
jgi:membrane associated rhomboid family serine protease